MAKLFYDHLVLIDEVMVVIDELELESNEKDSMGRSMKTYWYSSRFKLLSYFSGVLSHVSNTFSLAMIRHILAPSIAFLMRSNSDLNRFSQLWPAISLIKPFMEANID